MATIVTNPNYIQVDGTRIQKGTRDIIPLTGGVRLQNTGHGQTTDILVEGTTIDGAQVESVDSLLTFLDSQGFKSGGGDGTVGVADITGLTDGNLIFGGAAGNEQRKLLPSDLGVSTSGQRAPYSLDGQWSSLVVGSGSAIPNSFAVRRSSGQIQTGDATADQDAISLVQFKGIVNDTLTNAETSATLNTAYGSAVVGTRVTAPTALTEYTKISPTQWSKKTIEIV